MREPGLMINKKSLENSYSKLVNRYQPNICRLMALDEFNLTLHFYSTDGSSYEGMFTGGTRDGYGIFTAADGSKLSGQWRND